MCLPLHFAWLSALLFAFLLVILFFGILLRQFFVQLFLFPFWLLNFGDFYGITVYFWHFFSDLFSLNIVGLTKFSFALTFSVLLVHIIPLVFSFLRLNFIFSRINLLIHLIFLESFENVRKLVFLAPWFVQIQGILGFMAKTTLFTLVRLDCNS